MWRFAFHRFMSDVRNLIPVAIVTAFFVIAALAPILSPLIEDPALAPSISEGSTQRPLPPSQKYLLGTMPGRVGVPTSEYLLSSLPGGFDIYHSLIWGTRSALSFGIIVAVLTSTFGILLGGLFNFLGGFLARIGLRITDAFVAFPVLAGILLFIQVLKPVTAGIVEMPLNDFQQLMADLHLEPVMLGLIVFSWMPYCRMTFASMDQQKSLAYVDAARVNGLSNWQIFIKHILPNILTPLIVLITRDIGGFVVMESALEFIGVSDITEWGRMIATSRNWIISPSQGFAYWWTFMPVTLVLIMFSVGWQLLGQRINDALNPREFSYLN
jgi:ABC-type dipeptide/oligopeptide/nickel transport system permease subunit